MLSAKYLTVTIATLAIFFDALLNFKAHFSVSLRFHFRNLGITKRERGTLEEKAKFTLLQKGIIAFGTGYLMSGNFRIDDAVPASARIAYMAAKILVNDMSPLSYYEGQDIKDLNIENPDWNFLNRLKRQPDKSSFYYWYQTVGLLKV